MDAANPNPAGDPAIFSAVISPHRSLSGHGFIVMMGAVLATALFFGVIFHQLGAWPVLGFLGLGVVLIWIAFRASYRAAWARETVDVSVSEILVRRISAAGRITEWRFNPRWSRLLVERDEEAAVRRLALASQGRELEIAYWLSPPEKADFASALSGALSAARQGPMPA